MLQHDRRRRLLPLQNLHHRDDRRYLRALSAIDSIGGDAAKADIHRHMAGCDAANAIAPCVQAHTDEHLNAALTTGERILVWLPAFTSLCLHTASVVLVEINEECDSEAIGHARGDTSPGISAAHGDQRILCYWYELVIPEA